MSLPETDPPAVKGLLLDELQDFLVGGGLGEGQGAQVAEDLTAFF